MPEPAPEGRAPSSDELLIEAERGLPGDYVRLVAHFEHLGPLAIYCPEEIEAAMVPILRSVMRQLADSRRALN